MAQKGGISSSSMTVAKNTVFLYFRMLLMILIGLFTSRVVLNALGVDDYGIYNAVGGVVAMFTILTTSISNAIIRFITYSLGEGNVAKLRRVFSTSVVIQIGFSIAAVLLVETVGLWFLHHKMNIPALRMDAANWVLHFSAGLLVVQLLSVPYNATIIAHEKMGAYAYISILEAVLKLSVAAAIFFTGSDKLKVYAVLMFVVSVIVRAAYTIYCHKHFEETKSKLVFDKSLLSEMGSFAGWNVLGSGSLLLNTQGMNILTNLFFGVAVNAARGVATQVENIIKQFSSNFMTAINPQITKSYAAGNVSYAVDLVTKASKYTYLILLLLSLPFAFESSMILRIWLGDNVPEYSSVFVSLTLFGVIADMTANSLTTITLATGKLRRYYLLSSIATLSGLPLAWLCFKMGYSPVSAYVVFIAVYVMAFALKLYVVKGLVEFPVRKYLVEVVGKTMLVTVPSALLCYAVCLVMKDSFVRLLVVGAVSTGCIAAFSWFFAMTEGERQFAKDMVLSKILRKKK